MQLPLNDGQFATIDAADFEAIHTVKFSNGMSFTGCIAQLTWRAQVKPHTTYCICMRSGCEIRLHRLIMDAVPDQLIDHDDGNGLNNQRSNLRVATCEQNSQNRKANTGKESKGVIFHERSGKWHAHIRVRKIKHHIGTFLTEEEAQTAYNERAIAEFGEFAKPVELATVS